MRRQKSHPQTPIAKVKAKHQKLYPRREDHSTPVFGSRVRSQSVTVLRRSATVLTILCQNVRRSATVPPVRATSAPLRHCAQRHCAAPPSRTSISPVSRQYLASISPVSHQYVASISPVSHQYLASISRAPGMEPLRVYVSQLGWKLRRRFRADSRPKARHPQRYLFFTKDAYNFL